MKTRTANGKLKAVKYVDGDEQEDSGDDSDAVAYEHEDSSDGDTRPYKKRRQSGGNASTSNAAGSSTSKGKAKGNGSVYRGKNVGKLAKLLEMPVDIFCEITVYLEPLDLLRLARSTRGFNMMLMSRNSRPIWRTARNYYADLPDCPPDLSEPEYARLLFERDCHACLAPRVLKADYVLRARLCYRCRSSNIVKGTQLLKTIPDLTEMLLEYIPCRNPHLSGRRYRRLEYFYGRRVEAFVSRYVAAVPRGASEKEADVIQAEFLDRHKKLIEDIIEHAADIEVWLASDRITKRIEGSKAAANREANIRSKLIEVGYSESEFPVAWEDYEWTQIMSQPRDLTLRIWKAVRPRLEACIERAKARREQIARNTRRSTRRQELRVLAMDALVRRKRRDSQLIMTFDNVLELPTVSAMFTEDDYRQQVTQARWDAAWEQIEKEMDAYAEQARTHVVNLVITARQKEAAKRHSGASQHSDATESSESPPVDDSESNATVDTAFLLSPSTLFYCQYCSALLRYPALLEHMHSWTSKLTLDGLTFDTTASTIANAFLASLGDETVCSPEQSLICLRCDDNISLALSWAEMIKHFKTEQAWYDEELVQRQNKSSSSSSADIPLNNDHALGTDLPMVAALSIDGVFAQRAKVRAWKAGEVANTTCGLCVTRLTRPMTRKETALHIKVKHLKDHPGEGDFMKTYF